MRIWATTLGCVLIAGSVGAQPIHQHPQKAAYASPAEWPTLSGDCWWGAPGVGPFADTPAHVGHMTMTSPVWAETTGGPFTATFAITLFNAKARVISLGGAHVLSWALDGGVTLPLQGDPTGAATTWTGTAVFASTDRGIPLKGWYQYGLNYRTQFTDGTVTTTILRLSAYSVIDPLAAPGPQRNDTLVLCTVKEIGQPEKWGEHNLRFSQMLPVFGPISPELPWRLTGLAWNYGGAGGLQSGAFGLRVDPDIHNGIPGTTVVSKTGGGDLVYTLPSNLPDGPHKLLWSWRRPTLAGDKELTGNLVFTVTVGPGGVAQFPSTGVAPPAPTPPTHGTPTPTPTPHD